jgi:shikimate dehydrogenase
VDALCDAGIARLALQDIDPGRVAALRTLFGEAFPDVALTEGHGGLEGFDLVVNASPAGMGGTGELPIPESELAGLRAETLVADVVTKPPLTPFLLAAQARGCRIQTGAEMTAGQIGLLGGFMRALPETIE